MNRTKSENRCQSAGKGGEVGETGVRDGSGGWSLWKPAWESEGFRSPKSKYDDMLQSIGVPHPSPVVSGTGYSIYRQLGEPALGPA